MQKSRSSVPDTVSNQRQVRPSTLTQQMVVFCMRADPEPEDIIAFPNPDRPIVQPDASREDRAGGMDLPETQARMMRILLEQRVGLPGLLANMLGQGPVQHPELRHQKRVHSSSTSSLLARPAPPRPEPHPPCGREGRPT